MLDRISKKLDFFIIIKYFNLLTGFTFIGFFAYYLWIFNPKDGITCIKILFILPLFLFAAYFAFKWYFHLRKRC
jgi:hypothetical protein